MRGRNVSGDEARTDTQDKVVAELFPQFYFEPAGGTDRTGKR
jgi:hypothetical protein